MIPKRSALLAIFLTVAVVIMVVKTSLLWREGPWDLPHPPKVSSPSKASQPDPAATQPRMAATDIVISKNLFDPERGAGQTKEAEANSRAMQRLRGLILLGTAILGESRYAIVQDSGTPAAGRPPQGQSGQTMRFKMGDIFEGFSLSQIQDKNIVFTNGAARVELALDYFRRVEAARPPAGPAAPAGPQPAAGGAVGSGVPPSAVAPRVIPQLPRRERLPQPPAP